MPLKGVQLSLLPEVMPYVIANSPLVGEQVTTHSGMALITRVELVGETLILWADYGSGVEHPHTLDTLIEPSKIVLGGRLDREEPINLPSKELQAQAVDPLAPKFEAKACGWIGWKESKRERKRRDPWICRQAWLYWEEPGGKKRSRYIPKAKLAAVEESVYGLKRPIYQTLELLEKSQ